MKIVRFIDRNGHARLGVDFKEGTAELLQGELFGELVPLGTRVRVHSLLTPVEPPNILGIGLNYREHAMQMGVTIPDHPVMFMKPTTSLANPGEAILIPKCATDTPEVDYECELAVVIGKTARDVPVDQALQYVFGYTAANDVSARQWAKVSRTRGKCFDRFCPLGPVLVTADEIPDPQILDLSTKLNGTIMQKGNTADMIFSVAELVSYASQDTTLLPGTVILTGTPPGAGVSRTPPVYLEPGDKVEIEVEMIGTLSNPVSTEADSITTVA